MPTAFVHTVNDGLNSFWIRSYDCTINQNVTDVLRCSDCNTLNRTFRNKSPEEVISMSAHNKVIKNYENKLIKSSDEFSLLKEKMKTQTISYNHGLNKIRKKVAYWKGICKDLRSAVNHWRDVEKVRNGFLSVDDDEAKKWFEFYAFIDDLIDKEHADDKEKCDLHKELIRSELENLGKYNKSNNKRGKKNTKISSRILNYSLGLADSLGKVKYEAEASLRSLPSWSSLSR